ncbi:MAG TPA: DUF4352 domain-containing protein [Myxococcales bacterium]|nr:DUF4352 domain-containing protein [Myxococcales bacterium]
MAPPRKALWVVAVLAPALLVACDRPSPSADDRTLARLKEEAARQDPAAAERLAQVAVAEPAATRRTLPVPKQPRLAAGPLQMEVVALTASQVVEGQKVSLATEDRFLRVQLAVKNAGAAAATADLSRAALVGAGQRTWAVARDVQRLAGTAALVSGLAPGESRDFVMFFEVPEAALAGGLKLAVSGAEAGRNGDGVISLD